MFFAYPVHTSHYLCLKYSADNFSTPKQLTHCYHFTLNLTVPTGISTLARLFLIVCGIQGVTFGRFTAESDAAAKEHHNPDRLMPASPLSESDTAFID
ncbi:hypothetical protein [Xenorhabdus budapestensis]|uniref:hypothetical protein n=1 Tax=Xenorhabdus budapestensis TaxID=290110 RepID=UPI0011AB7A4A|nr:hypothetical protein [Xenorhabdus budapestensis]